MKIEENTLTVLKTVFPLIGIVILFFIVGQFGFSKITDIRSQVDAAQTEQTVLTQKLDVLRNISGSGAKLSNIAVAAFPDSNPSLAVLSQIKILAGSQGVTLSDIKSSPAITATGLSTVNFTLSVTGSRSQVESFISSVSTIAPISIVTRVKMTQSDPVVTLGQINIASFWAPFPTTVPPINKAIPDLTPDEQATLKYISGLTLPTFVDVTAAPGGKGDPFSP